MKPETRNSKLKSSKFHVAGFKISGFTLLELLVTTSIFLIITSVVVAGYPKFRSQISVGKVAREMAIATRQAQAFGLAVRELGGAAPSAYGVYFSASERREMIVFADKSGGRRDIYDPGDGCGADNSECVERFLMKGVSIRDLCASPGGLDGDEECLGDDPPLERIDISFRRADPDSRIYRDANNNTAYAAAYIHLQSDRYPERRKVMRVWVTGQISVQDDQ